MDFSKLPVRTYFVLKDEIFYIKKSVAAVIDSKPYTPKQK